jgi:hypothetical protein
LRTLADGRPWARLALMALLAMPTAAIASDPIVLRLAQAADRDGGFEDCVTVCQRQIDARIAQCPGYREIANPAASSPPPPKCKATAIEQFESCKAQCPAPRVPLPG